MFQQWIIDLEQKYSLKLKVSDIDLLSVTVSAGPGPSGPKSKFLDTENVG